MFLTFRSPSDFVSANQFMLYLFVDAAGDIDFAGTGNAFKPRGDIDAVAIDVVGFDDDVAKIDADPILDPMMLGQRCIAANQILLDHDAASDGFDGTVENRDEAVARGFDKPAVMFGDAGSMRSRSIRLTRLCVPSSSICIRRL